MGGEEGLEGGGRRWSMRNALERRVWGLCIASALVGLWVVVERRV